MQPLSPQDWHHRFFQQAQWTHQLRGHVYERIGIQNARTILDVGCGTGILLNEISSLTEGSVYGLDINSNHLVLAKQHAPGSNLTLGDAHHLPYTYGSFDVTLCHFVLMWLNDPFLVLRSMSEVTAPGGVVLALAEPDYGGRIDYPAELEPIGRMQLKSLRHQGADPLIGRKLGEIFSQAGFQHVETGVLGGQWTNQLSPVDQTEEWKIILSDLDQITDTQAREEIRKLRSLDTDAWERGARVLFVPTFYAIGWVR
jgi:ubiquinone/menaquinone biosynthesis C-methylase UbiE